MADKTYYAWTDIMGASAGDADGKNKQLVKKVKAGDTVTASDLDLNDDQFAELVESGAVRITAFPDLPPGWTGSPVDFWRKQLKDAAAGIDDSTDGLAAMANATAHGDDDGTSALTPPEEEEEEDDNNGANGST